jgi:hypothetical protein
MTAAREAAAAWLRSHLRDGRWHAAADVKAAAAAAGIGPKSLMFVAGGVVERERRAGHFAFWRLPANRRRSTWITPVLDAGDAT